MKFVEPSFEIIEQGTTLNDVYKHIEFCGRTCYKSTDKITEDSAKPFVDRMIASQHYAMLEHGTVYLTIPDREPNEYGQTNGTMPYVGQYTYNPYSRVTYKHWEQDPDELQSEFCKKIPRYTMYITTNLRVIVENHWESDLQYVCEPTEHHIKRHTVKFICNRQVSHEFVRHRVFSFAQESTRYCNYTKDKFGNELTFINPCWGRSYGENEMMKATLKTIENNYFNLIKCGWKPQQAATILPNALKTELIMTGFESDWDHFFDLRALGTTGTPHPQAEELALPLYNKFVELGYCNEHTTISEGSF